MASETKLQNSGNKAPVALPTSGLPPTSPTISMETILSGVMGARVRVTTCPPSSATYEGFLYTADPITNLIVLAIPPSPSSSSSSSSTPVTSSNNSNSSASSPMPLASSPSTFKILPIPQLTSFTILSLAGSNTSPTNNAPPNLPSPTALDIPSLTHRLTSTIANLKAQDAKRGRGVTREAQDIFDGISRTYPAHWMGTTMVINGDVAIKPPYHIEDCELLSATELGQDAGNGGTSGGKGGVSAEQRLLRFKKVLGMEREKLALRRGLGAGGLGLGKIRGIGTVAGPVSGTGAGAGPGAGIGLSVGIGQRKGG